MNVLFLDSIEKVTFGGMEEWIRLTAGGLAASGHSVTVAGRPESEFLRRVEESEFGVTILPLEISGDFNPATIGKLKKHLAESSTDVIIVNFNKDVRLGGLAARLEGRPKVIWSVGLDITKDTLIHRLLTPRLVDGVIVPSSALKKQITHLKYIDENIVEIIPIGIADRDHPHPDKNSRFLLREKYHWPSDAVVAVTVGRLVNQKGHRYLVEAIRQIINKNRMARFIFVGDGPLRKELEKQIDELKLGEIIAITGMLDNFDFELYGADIMIHPSAEEPFGIAVLEGMRAGLPIVASRVGGIPEVVKENENAILVPSLDPDALAVAALDIIGDKPRCVEMGKAGRTRWVDQFRLDTMIERVEKYLQIQCEFSEPSHG